MDYDFQNEYSNLLDAYKKNELIGQTSLAVYSLSSIPVDRPEPSESLIATTVWSSGPGDERMFLLSDHQVKRFTSGDQLQTETDVRASRGAYFLHAAFELRGNSAETWMMAADVNQDSTAVANLLLDLQNNKNICEAVDQDIRKGTENLKRIIGSTDGFQASNEDLNAARHMSNSLFNVMRGGIFLNGYQVDTKDFSDYVHQTNRTVFKKYSSWLGSLPETISYPELMKQADSEQDHDLFRIATEYFPLTFSRRHGDPSRPWNYFSIENKNPDGTVKLHYEGNWRDIFQNWEALSLSFPEYLE